MVRILQLLVALAIVVMATGQGFAEDYYVSATRGKGKKATQEKPAKDLGNIVSKLKPGDTIHIAEGVYTGRGDCGTCVITVPVTIIGGYDDQFSTRDPWGAHQTVFSGDNLSDNWKREPALMIDLMKYKGREMPEILVDGIIVDHSARNRYASPDQLEIVRAANPKTKENPTPDQGGLVVRASKTGDLQGTWKITVQNCIVTNAAPTQGALSVSGYKNSEIVIRNNLVINNTGTGIYAGTRFAGRDSDSMPRFQIENNTVMFTWKFDPAAQSFSGNSIKFDAGVHATLNNNVFAFADKIGLHNAAKATVLLTDNTVTGNVVGDYLEFDTRMNLDELEDEAEYIHEDSNGNSRGELKVPVNSDWAKNYGSRVLIDRNAAEADIQVQMTAANELRSMLGLPLQAGNVEFESSPVWLNRMMLEDAIRCGAEMYDGRGCSMPR